MTPYKIWLCSYNGSFHSAHNLRYDNQNEYIVISHLQNKLDRKELPIQQPQNFYGFIVLQMFDTISPEGHYCKIIFPSAIIDTLRILLSNI